MGLLVSALTLGIAPAQSSGQPYFRNYSTDDGLPSSEVHDILQDRQGYLWIATDNGVSRFDGYAFKNFGAKEGLKNNVVFYLHEDEAGRIWMQTMSGNLYYYEQDSIAPYRYNAVIEEYNNYIYSINNFIHLPDGTLYVGLYGLGILKIEPDGKHRLLNAEYFKTMVILTLPQQARSLFVSVGRMGLKYLGWDQPQSSDLYDVGIFSDTLQYSCFLPNKQANHISFSYAEPGFILINTAKEMDISTDCSHQTTIPIPAALAEVTKIKEAFWMGFNDRQGVRYYQDQKAIFQDKYQLFLEGKSISAICPDKFGGYWFGSLNDGIFYAPNLALESYLTEEIPLDFHITTLALGQQKQLLFGTDKGAVYTIGPNGHSLLVYDNGSPIFDLWYNAVEQTLWVAATPMQVFNGKTAQAIIYPPKWNLSNKVTAKKIQPSRDNRLAYGTNGFGFEIIDILKKQVVFSTLNTFAQKRVLTAFDDLSGRIWIGNTRGLFQFRAGQFDSPPVDHPLFHLRVEDIDQLADSTLVIATKGGGIALWKDDSIDVIDESTGLIANMIENITVDQHQQIWVGTLNGLNKISKQPGSTRWQVKRLTMAHGLPSNEIIDLCELDDQMYVATSRGIVLLPVIDTTRAGQPAVFLESILVNGQPRSLNALRNLDSRERNIQLGYVCINYKFDGNIPYRYRLTSDKDWSYTQNRSVNYAALAPGQYTFEVQAQNEDGNWGDSLNIPFRIATPFWQRWWFILLLAASLGRLLYYLYRRRISLLEKEAAIEREINELQRSALQAQMNPHFIFNCLNSIQNFIASGDKGNAMQYLSRFAKLVRTTLHASVQSVISLEEEIQVIENYLELEKLRFGQRFEYKIAVDPNLDQFDTSLPPLLVQPFVENAIIHAFNFEDKSKVGQIYLAYQQEADHLRITIRDNGIGINHSRQTKVHSQNLRTSLGMAITEKRLGLHSHALNGQSLQINELRNNLGEITGTEIIISIRI